MKALVFDTGPLISLSLNNLLWLFEKLKIGFSGEFYITSNVKREAVDSPLNSKRFKFEAIQLLRQIDRGTIDVYEHVGLASETQELLDLANNIYSAHGNYIKIVHRAEIESLAACLRLDASALVVDEFTMRAVIEKPEKVEKRLKKKLHTHIDVNRKNLTLFSKKVQGVKIIRSVELITVAFEKGLLDDYKLMKEEPEKNLLDAVLWGAKMNGCSISEEEIRQIMRFEGY
ncbi:MAG: hypothetical protein KKF44_04990 [Nanoarchaeota archaeon]|nr:hypothetical protein [Nanoarchaeota archaeon]